MRTLLFYGRLYSSVAMIKISLPGNITVYTRSYRSGLSTRIFKLSTLSISMYSAYLHIYLTLEISVSAVEDQNDQNVHSQVIAVLRAIE